jgi:hypothetical protein
MRPPRSRAVGRLHDGGVRVCRLQVFHQHPPHDGLVFDDQHGEFSLHLRQPCLGKSGRLPPRCD